MLYTGRGDRGETRAGKGCVPKDSETVEVIGEIDELVSLLGVLASESEKCREIERIISDLMSLNAHIVSGGEHRFRGDVGWLEERIDSLWREAGELNRFILRFTDRLASTIHYARAVCRRVERRLVGFSRRAGWLDAGTLAYINRLSDYLFALARWTNRRRGGKEILWT